MSGWKILCDGTRKDGGIRWQNSWKIEERGEGKIENLL